MFWLLPWFCLGVLGQDDVSCGWPSGFRNSQQNQPCSCHLSHTHQYVAAFHLHNPFPGMRWTVAHIWQNDNSREKQLHLTKHYYSRRGNDTAALHRVSFDYEQWLFLALSLPAFKWIYLMLYEYVLVYKVGYGSGVGRGWLLHYYKFCCSTLSELSAACCLSFAILHLFRYIIIMASSLPKAFSNAEKPFCGLCMIAYVDVSTLPLILSSANCCALCTTTAINGPGFQDVPRWRCDYAGAGRLCRNSHELGWNPSGPRFFVPTFLFCEIFCIKSSSGPCVQPPAKNNACPMPQAHGRLHPTLRLMLQSRFIFLFFFLHLPSIFALCPR